MTVISGRSVYIEPSCTGGTEIRTADSRRAMITELLLNSGSEIALWGEAEAKRIADVWRGTLARCERCDGAGEIAHPDAGGAESEDSIVPCPVCGGSGKK